MVLFKSNFDKISSNWIKQIFECYKILLKFTQRYFFYNPKVLNEQMKIVHVHVQHYAKSSEVQKKNSAWIYKWSSK